MHYARFMGIALLVGIIAMAGCASNITSTVKIGFIHQELVNEIDGTGDNNGWEVGGTVGFEFDEKGLSAIETCGVGGLILSNLTIGDELKTVSNIIPAAICTEFELSPDYDGGS